MHVGFALLTLAPGQMGGSESYVRGLLGQFGAGNGPERVTVLANEASIDAYRPFARGRVSLHTVSRYHPGRSRLSRAAAMVAGHLAPQRIASAVPDDLALLHFPVTVPIPRTHLPEVVTLHDVQHHDLPGFFSPAERALRRLTYDAAARRANVVVTPSEYSRERIVNVLTIPAERIEVVPWGINRERFRTAPSAEDGVLGSLGLNHPFLVYPANLWPHKNHERLVDALAATGHPELELVLTGRTYGRLDPLLARARRSGIANRVRHLGYLEPEALPAVYRAARAMIFPSLYEGFGTPPLEAMACGCPVASSTRGALAEVCGDVLPLEPDSIESIAVAIESVGFDDELRNRLRVAGLEHVGRFSWKAAAARHTAIYAHVAATSSTS
jgi:glycosyltransferase involved in cell wall biosynthesis